MTAEYSEPIRKRDAEGTELGKAKCNELKLEAVAYIWNSRPNGGQSQFLQNGFISIIFRNLLCHIFPSVVRAGPGFVPFLGEH